MNKLPVIFYNKIENFCKLNPDKLKKIEVRNSYAICLSNYLEFLVIEENYNDLFRCFQESQELFPNDPEVLNVLGVILNKTKRPVEALKYIHLALAICPEKLTYMENKDNIINQWIARWHFVMLNDINRNNAYKRAIAKKIDFLKPDNILDIGTGTGLLSVYCHENSKSSQIYACESDDLMANIAEKVFEKNELPVKLLRQHSTSINLNELNIKGFDFIVTEIFDSGAFGESVLETLIHAKSHLLTENGRIIPEKINIYVAGINKIGLSDILQGIDSTLENSIYLKNTILVPRIEEPYEVLDQNAYKIELCTEPILAFSVDLNDLSSLQNAFNGQLDRQIELTCLDDGIIEGFLVYFVLELDKENKLSNFDITQTHWLNSLNNDNSENSTNNSTDENINSFMKTLDSSLSPKKFKCWDPIKFSLYQPITIRKYQILKINISCQQGILKLNHDFNIFNKRILEIPMEIFTFLADDEFILELEYNVDKAIKKYSSNEENMIFGDFLPFPHIGINLLKENKISKLYCSAQVKDLIEKVSTWNCIKKHLIIFIDDFESLFNEKNFIKFDFILLQPISSCGNLNQSHLKYYQILRHHLKPHGFIFPAKIDVSCKLIYSDWLNKVTTVNNKELKNLGIEDLINEYSTKKQFEFVNFDANFLSDIFTVSAIQYDENLYKKEIVVNICSNLQNQYNRVNGILYFYKIFFMNNSIPLSTNRKKSFIKSNCFICDYDITNKNNVKIQYIQNDFIFRCKIIE